MEIIFLHTYKCHQLIFSNYKSKHQILANKIKSQKRFKHNREDIKHTETQKRANLNIIGPLYTTLSDTLSLL